MKTYLMSWLARQHQGSDLETFARECPGPWLVWEAGPWQPPPGGRETVRVAPDRGRAAAGEGLAMVVAPRPGRLAADGVRLGRAPENDLAIDDGTLSRAHLLMQQDAEGRWTVSDLRSSNGTRLGGAPLDDAPKPLEPGARLEAGSVRLTFYDGPGLFLRLRHGVR